MEIHFLKADNGDSIWIRLEHQGEPKNIIIDGGLSTTYLDTKNKKGKPEDGALKKVIDSIKDRDQKIDLLILSHVDDDHIGGILRWFQKDNKAYEFVSSVWFNSGKLISEHFNKALEQENEVILNISTNTNTSIAQGIAFEAYLKEHNIWDRILIHSGLKLERFGIKFEILSPSEKKLEKLLKKWKKEKPDYKTTGKENDYHKSIKDHLYDDEFKEDTSAHNGSSIAFMMSYNTLNWLFLADAHPSVIIEALEKLGYSREQPVKADLVKLSHHGSKLNNSKDLLRMIQSDRFIVSTNGRRHNHPDKQMLSRLIDVHPDCKILFNYGQQIDAIFSAEDLRDFPGFTAKPITQKFSYFVDTK